MFPNKALVVFTFLAISGVAQAASLPAAAIRDIQVIRSNNTESLAILDVGIDATRDLASLAERKDNDGDSLEPRAGPVTTMVRRSTHSVERATRAIRKWRRGKKSKTSKQELAKFTKAIARANKHLICAGDRLLGLQRRDMDED
ncbi:hypothetical protein CF326_g8664, partial [Tilletia indica]